MKKSITYQVRLLSITKHSRTDDTYCDICMRLTHSSSPVEEPQRPVLGSISISCLASPMRNGPRVDSKSRSRSRNRDSRAEGRGPITEARSAPDHTGLANQLLNNLCATFSVAGRHHLLRGTLRTWPVIGEILEI